MASSLSPAFVRVNYTSVYGAHVMTLPSVPIVTGINAPSFHDFDLRGAEISVECDDAVKDFINVIKADFIASTTFVDYTLFTQADAEATPVPVWSAALGIVGTHADDSWSKAVQRTFTWRTDAFGLFKLVFLDCISANNFSKNTSLPDGSTRKAISDYVTADETWLAGRDGGRPATFLQESVTLNEKLRRSYNLT